MTRRVQALCVGLTLAGLALLLIALVIWLSGGLRTEVLDVRVRATDPFRPVLLGVTLLAIRALLRSRVSFDAEAQLFGKLSRPPVIAAILVILTMATALNTNYGVGGGSDSYGYVSEADLWLAGDLTVEQEWVRDAPWPNRLQTATPLAYRLSPSGQSIVPVYAPGLPMLFAGAKRLIGQCGIVAVIAVMAGALVWLTYAIGRRVASAQVGAGAAWLIATCPVVIFMMASPMSDVPAAAMSAAAAFACLHRSKRAAVLGGLAMAGVILIRPNLAPLAGFIGLWLLLGDRATATWAKRLVRSLLFGLAASTAVVFLALFNASLYGSPLASGYGSLDGFFAASHILPNIRNYSQWLVESQTPLMMLGLMALAVPQRWFGNRQGIADSGLLALVSAGLIVLYLPYTVFDRWWYLRFFLPAWPAMAIVTAWLFTNSTGRSFGRIGVTGLLLMGAWGLRFAATHEGFTVGWSDLRYVSAAHVVREVTRPGSVILSMQHSGSVNYYSGRHRASL